MIKRSQNKIKQFIEKVVGNRIFDLYLKYKGIQGLGMVSSATLVPFALILGRKAFKHFIKNDIEQNQKGGFALKKVIDLIDTTVPVVDDELFGNFLKISGLTAMTISPKTLIPLGILMSVYEIYNKNKDEDNQKGGAIGNNLQKSLSKIIDNRVLDIYLKFLGIKMLNSATLVPFALLFGKEAFKYYITDDIKENKSINQFGGTKIPKNLPIIDDELLGTYLKVIGLSAMDISMNTLVPLGLVMALYELYINQ